MEKFEKFGSATKKALLIEYKKNMCAETKISIRTKCEQKNFI